MPQCSKCAQEIPADAPGGLCPSCAIRGALDPSDPGLAPTTTAKAPVNDEFAAPTVDDLNALLPQFRVEAEIGRGGMGVVYRGTQLNLDRPVAIKLLAPHLAADRAFAERFAREARALARLSHPNIVAVYDFGQAGSFFYLVMELVDGANLRHVIHKGGIEPKQALTIVPQICDALQYAHDEGIVHRDIKPENILLDRRGRVKIADFGLAKLLGREPGDVSLTATQQVMGTLRYMAPEQVGGTKSLDHRADIYSLGVVFYELLTGESPIGRFAPRSKKVQIDVRLDEVVLRALEQEPEQRYQHVSELKTEVESVRLNPAPATEARAEAAAARGPIGDRSLDDAVGKPVNQPRLSRCALWGAVCVPLVYLGAWFIFLFCVKDWPPELRGSPPMWALVVVAWCASGLWPDHSRCRCHWSDQAFQGPTLRYAFGRLRRSCLSTPLARPGGTHRRTCNGMAV